jgi:hypothetical protein
VADVKAAANFYQRAFGFEKRGIMNDRCSIKKPRTTGSPDDYSGTRDYLSGSGPRPAACAAIEEDQPPRSEMYNFSPSI